MATELLRFENVSKRFPNGVAALDGVEFAIQRGSFVSLVGPSGSGKSTILRLAASLTDASSGRIVWNGPRPRLGFVFQDAALMPWATVERNVSLPLEILGTDRATIAARTKETLALVGLSQFAQAFPRELSGGMKMRVSLARALAPKPEVLLMDEPFAALDEFTREHLNDELRSLWRAQHLTVLFVTHSIYESVYLSSRVLVVGPRPGRIVADLAMADPDTRTPEFRLTPQYGERTRALRAALAKSGERAA